MIECSGFNCEDRSRPQAFFDELRSSEVAKGKIGLSSYNPVGLV